MTDFNQKHGGHRRAARPQPPDLTTSVYHGGNLQAAQRRFGAPSEGWLDLSTGINPVPYAIDGVALDDWTRLPERDAEQQLEATAADFYGLTDAERLMVTPGTQAVIQALPRLLSVRSVAILDFTYQEHAACWRARGAHVRTIDSLDDAPLGDAEIVVAVNPNNPDGRLIARGALLSAAERLARRGGLLIVDEAFMDVVGHAESVLPKLPQEGIVVLRSLGKTWGLAGARLGFAAGPSAVIADLRAFFGPWAVNGPAMAIAKRALKDKDWLAATLTRLAADAAALDAILTQAGLQVIGGTPLFRLTRHEAASAIFERLGRAGILARPFPEREGWLRFGVPATDADRRRLAGALAT